MKKSTIFLLALVYIASFLIVGIFGINIKNYDSIAYIDRINIEIAATQVAKVNPTIPNGMKVEEDEVRHCSCLVRYYYVEKTTDGQIQTIVRVKAAPYPTNATTTELRFVANEQSDVATVTQEDNYYFNVSFKIKGSFKFDVYSTDGYGAHTTVKFMYK